MLIIICGLPGVGKSLIAEKLAKKLQAEHISIDGIRRKYLKDNKYFRYEDKSFPKEERNLAYKKMLEVARNKLKQNKNIILESSFSTAAKRKRIIRLAKQINQKYFLIEITCPEKIVKKG